MKKPKFAVTADYSDKFHFFGSSVGAWCAKATLDEVVASMKRDGLSFSVFYVPLPLSADYGINYFKPVVPGAVFLGCWEPVKGAA